MIKMRLRDEFIYIIKSAFASMTFFIPGLNLFSVLYGFSLYKIVVSCFCDLKNRDSIKRLFFIMFGLLLGYFSINNFKVYLLDRFEFQIYLFFIGIIVGGIKISGFFSTNVFSLKKFFLFAISCIFIILMNNVVISNKILVDITINNYILYFIIGIFCGINILIPGFGLLYLDKFIVFPSNYLFVILFIIGVVFGIYLMCNIINNVFKKYSNIINIILVGFLFADIISIFINFNFSFNFINIFSGILLFLWGYLLSINLEKE